MVSVHSTITEQMVDAKYLAGFFDGEGCIDVQRMYSKGKYAGRTYVRPRVRIGLAISGLPVLEALQSEFGGYIGKQYGATANSQPRRSWDVTAKQDVIRVLETILPYLILKKEQAKLALAWFEHYANKREDSRGFENIGAARDVLIEELQLMKKDPQRLSERALTRIESVMRQSELHGDMQTPAETTGALAA